MAALFWITICGPSLHGPRAAPPWCHGGRADLREDSDQQKTVTLEVELSDKRGLQHVLRQICGHAGPLAQSPRPFSSPTLRLSVKFISIQRCVGTWSGCKVKFSCHVGLVKKQADVPVRAEVPTNQVCQ
ncbi:hypothetical protein M378DRAFT_168510 [Amanita muscaria Koide BX008]|uniref:Uncharacterized protein n=1 Tax=Amanita muscaria (strain Koide BX008) TaxID=946122 RepID=A0A0C2T108_AMAMK|nr:hypothetical protein M378DRAFT_168510 [Amanita muscaria Koide BX008]